MPRRPSAPTRPTMRARGCRSRPESPTAARMMRALERALPVGARAEERERRTDMPSSTTPSTVPAIVPRPPVIAAPPTTTAAMTFISRPRPVLRRNLVEAHGVDDRGESGERAGEHEDASTDRAVSMPASRAASRIRPGRVHGAPGRAGDRSVHAVEHRAARAAVPTATSGIRALRESEPLKAGRQVLDPRALVIQRRPRAARPWPPGSRRSTGCAATRPAAPLTAPSAAPISERDADARRASARPTVASVPATTLHDREHANRPRCRSRR